MSRKTFTRLVTLSQPSGIEVNVNLVLGEKPIREEQKLKTLTKYVQQYPSGWKKRLELADLLYGMGKWQDAVEEYFHVIERQPQLIQVKLKLGKILQLMGRETEAIEVYERALSLVSDNLTTQSHILGLIEVCRHDFQKAVEAFELATTFEPDNPSHWLALGQVQMEIGNTVKALAALEAILSRYPDDIIALINSYDALIGLGKKTNQSASMLNFLDRKKRTKPEKKDIDFRENNWYDEAEKRLSKAIALAPDNYQVLKRWIEYRYRMKCFSGKEGKQTKQLLNTLLKLAPNSADAHQLTAYYYLMRGGNKKGGKVSQNFTDKYPLVGRKLDLSVLRPIVTGKDVQVAASNIQPRMT